MNDFINKIKGAIQGLKTSFIDNPIKQGQQSISNWAQNNPNQAQTIIRASEVPQMVSTKLRQITPASVVKASIPYTQQLIKNGGANPFMQIGNFIGKNYIYNPDTKQVAPFAQGMIKTMNEPLYQQKGETYKQYIDRTTHAMTRMMPIIAGINEGPTAYKGSPQAPRVIRGTEDMLTNIQPKLPSGTIPTELQSLAENINKQGLTKNQFIQKFNEGLKAQNLTVRETAQKTLAEIKNNGMTLADFHNQATIQQSPPSQIEAQIAQQKVNKLAGQAVGGQPSTPQGGVDALEKQLHPDDVQILRTDREIEGWSDKQYTDILKEKIQELKDFNNGTYLQGANQEELRQSINELRRTAKEIGKPELAILVEKEANKISNPEQARQYVMNGLRNIRDKKFELFNSQPSTPQGGVTTPTAPTTVLPEPVVPQSAFKMQVGITSAQPANPSVADILKEGNAYFESGNIDAGLAKLHEVTLQTKPELQQLLSGDGASTINNLDTNTHGLYFGNPEPSFWLNLDTTDVNKTAASIAQFAKTHKQDSFITATPSVNPNASLGFKMSMGQPLTNQDILTIEKVFNDNGMGLTLNQKTGEGYAMNIKEFDGMTPEQFHTAYIKIRLALNQVGMNAKFILDKYDVGVYTKDTYDKLISNSIQSGRGNQAGERTTQAGGVVNRGTLDETRLNAGDISPQISQEKVTPPSVYTGQQNESQFINTLKDNPTIPTDLTNTLSSKYDMTSDQGRKDYGTAAAKQDLLAAYKRVIDATGDANELNGLTYGVTKELQIKAHDARVAGNIDMYDAYRKQFEQAAIAYQKRISPAAQTVQFSHVFKYTTPDGIVDMVKDIFDDANNLKSLSIGRAIRALSGKEWKLSLTPTKEQFIRDQMRDITLLPDAERIQATKALINEVTKDIPMPIMNLIDAHRYQNALSGWRTHMRNVVSNVFNSSIVKPVRLLDMAAWDLLKSTLTGKERTHFFNEVPTYYRGLFGSMQEATNVFMDTFQNGTALGKSDLPVDEFKTNLGQIMMQRTPKILNIAGRALEAADQFFVTLTSNGEYLRLKSKGVDETVARKMAKDFSKYILYKNELDLNNSTSQGLIMTKMDQFTNWLMKARNVLPPPLNWFIMFLRVPMDVAKMSLTYHPLTSIPTLAGMSDPTKVAEQWSNIRVGAAIALIGAAATISGKTTWNAPTDAKLKSAFYDTGRKPFSFAVDTPAGRVWVPFAYLGPWAMTFGLGAAYQNFFADSKTSMTDSTASKVGNMMVASLNQWAQSTPLSGVGGLMRTLQGDIDYNLVNQLSFTAGQMIPLNSLMTNIAAVVDPTFRRPQGFIQGLQKNIPWASTGLEPVTDSLGQPAQRNISDYILPYTLGAQNPAFEQQYQDTKLLQQQSSEANYYKKMADEAGGVVGTTSTGGGTSGTKVLSTQKGNLDKLYETYDTITDPATRAKIKKSITDRGVDFNAGYENYLMKDVKVKQQGLSKATQATLQRSNEFTFIKRLRDKYDGTGIGADELAAEMKKKNISQVDLEYDDKTALPDDVQIEEIKAGITGMSYEDMLTTLVSYRKISEGTRKELLTDTLIGVLNKEGIIDKNTAAWLKSTVWDAKTQSFTKAASTGGSKKTFPKITFPKPTAYKFTAPTISMAKITPIKLPASYKSMIRKAKVLKTAKYKPSSIRLPALPTFKSTLSSLRTKNGL